MLAAVKPDASDSRRLWRQLRGVLVTVHSLKFAAISHDIEANAVDGNFVVLRRARGWISRSTTAVETCEVIAKLELFPVILLLEPRKSSLLDSFGTI